MARSYVPTLGTLSGYMGTLFSDEGIKEGGEIVVSGQVICIHIRDPT